jgi:UDP-glucuronate 4-epimerase
VSKPQRVVVTGGAGFIGSHVVDALLARGDEVIAIDSFDPYYDPRTKRNNLAAASRCAAFRLVEEDVRDCAALGNALDGARCDAVIHLAAAVGVRPSIADPSLYSAVNVEGTASVLEFARQNGIPRFVFGSSSSVYGDRSAGPFVETDRVDAPISPYAATKRAGELLCYSSHRITGLSVMCLRFFTVYGPRQRPDLAIHKFVSMIERGEQLTLYGDGTTRRDYTHVTDITTGVLAALDHTAGVEEFEIVNLGGGNPVTLADLVDSLESLLGTKAMVESLPAQSGDVTQTFASIEKASRLLGFTPSMNFDDGLREFVEWFRGEAHRLELAARTSRAS